MTVKLRIHFGVFSIEAAIRELPCGLASGLFTFSIIVLLVFSFLVVVNKICLLLLNHTVITQLYGNVLLLVVP